MCTIFFSRTIIYFKTIGTILERTTFTTTCDSSIQKLGKICNESASCSRGSPSIKTRDAFNELGRQSICIRAYCYLCSTLVRDACMVENIYGCTIHESQHKSKISFATEMYWAIYSCELHVRRITTNV